MSFLYRLAQKFGRRSAQSKLLSTQNINGIYASQPEISSIMITLVGVPEEHIDEIISVTKVRFGSRHKIVYVTDTLNFMLFRNHEAIFEYLPSALEQKLHANEISWNSYLQKRWQLLLAKWKPLHVISYGQNIDNYILSARGLADPTALRL